MASAVAFANEGTTVNDGVDLASLGLNNLSAANTASNSTVDWVDEKDPPIKVGYDAINQRLEFTVDRTVLGSGTDSNFNSFRIYGSATAEETNNLISPAMMRRMCLSAVVRFSMVKVSRRW